MGSKNSKTPHHGENHYTYCCRLVQTKSQGLTVDNFDWVKDSLGDSRELYWWNADKLTIKQKNIVEKLAGEKSSMTFYMSSAVWWICKLPAESYETFTSSLDHKKHDTFCDELKFENQFEKSKIVEIPAKHINKYPPFRVLKNTSERKLSAQGYKWYFCKKSDMGNERIAAANVMSENGFAICLTNHLLENNKVVPTEIYYFYLAPNQYAQFLAGKGVQPRPVPG